MDKEQKQFLALLRAGLWNTPVDTELFSGHTEWDAIFAHASKQTVIGIVAGAVSTLPATIQPPIPIANKLRSIVIATIRSHSHLNRMLAEAITLFGQNGIPVVLLKGQGVASNYINPALRTCGDIDLYVGQQNYNKSCELAQQWGEMEEENGEDNIHYHFTHEGITVELHRIVGQLYLPWHNARFQHWVQKHLHGDHLRTIKIEGTEILLPPVNFDALYIFNHAWHHLSEGKGIGLRQLCDWVRYLHTFRDKINHAELEQDLKAFGLWRPWQTFGHIAVDVLGLPQSEYPFYTNRYTGRATRIIKMIEEGGNFGAFNIKKPDGYLAGKIYTLKWMNHRSIRLLTITPEETIIKWNLYLCAAIKRFFTLDNKSANNKP